MLTCLSYTNLPQNLQVSPTYGMKGWLTQSTKTLGWVEIDGCTAQLQAHLQGWFGRIILAASRTQKNRGGGAASLPISVYDPPAGMLAETSLPNGGVPTQLCANLWPTPTEPIISLAGMSTVCVTNLGLFLAASPQSC